MGWSKGIVVWRGFWPGTFYMSVPFTWNIPDALTAIDTIFKGEDVVVGGPAVKLMPEKFEGIKTATGIANISQDELPIYQRHNPEAVFTTRGCIRSCPFCAVPKIEGEFRELEHFPMGRVICDNNLTAASRAHLERVIDRLHCVQGVDFSQGLDARLFTDWHAEQIARLPRPLKVRFAFDSDSGEVQVADAIAKCRRAGIGKGHISVYCLIGFRDTPTSARERLELVRSWGVLPFPMRYVPLNSMDKRTYVAPGWTEDDLKRTVRYYSRLNYLKKISFDEYHYGSHEGQKDLFAEVDE